MSGRPRIAIPLPMSGNPEYVERSIPQYERAVEMAGGQPVRIPLDLAPAETMKIVERCDAVLLPGASADVDPAKYDAPRQEQTAPADPKRDTMIIDNTPTDTLDPASSLPNLGSKMGIDATTKWREEGYTREMQQLATVDEGTAALVNNKWKEYGFL